MLLFYVSMGFGWYCNGGGDRRLPNSVSRWLDAPKVRILYICTVGDLTALIQRLVGRSLDRSEVMLVRRQQWKLLFPVFRDDIVRALDCFEGRKTSKHDIRPLIDVIVKVLHSNQSVRSDVASPVARNRVESLVQTAASKS